MQIAQRQAKAASADPRETCEVHGVHTSRVSDALTGQASDAAYADVAALFGAMADPTRVRMIHLLMRQEMCTCDLAEVLRISESGVSQHLRVLRRLHLVKSRRAGKFVHYSLDDAHIALLMQIGLTHTGHADAAGRADTTGNLAFLSRLATGTKE